MVNVFAKKDLGSFQLLDLIITELKSHIQDLSLVKILFVKKNPLQDLLSSLMLLFQPMRGIEL